MRKVFSWVRKSGSKVNSKKQVCLFTQNPILHKDSTPESLQEAIERLQELLQFKGFLQNLSGQFDAETEQAVKVFQQENKLHVDGIVGPLTWAYLYYPRLSRQDSMQFLEDQKDVICNLQDILHREGFPTKDDSGFFGRDTEKAVKRFQRTYGLQPDGIVGAWTWALLLGVRPRSNGSSPDSLVLLLRQNLQVWEQFLMICCLFFGIYFSPLPGRMPEFAQILVTAWALTCVTPFLLELIKFKPYEKFNSPMLQYAPYVLTGIFWKPVLNVLMDLIQKLP